MTIRNVSVPTDGRKPLVRFGAIDAKHRPENIVFEDLTIDGKPVGGGRATDGGLPALPDALVLKIGKDAVAPKFVVSDARRMGAEEMNPGFGASAK